MRSASSRRLSICTDHHFGKVLLNLVCVIQRPLLILILLILVRFTHINRRIFLWVNWWVFVPSSYEEGFFRAHSLDEFIAPQKILAEWVFHGARCECSCWRAWFFRLLVSTPNRVGVLCRLDQVSQWSDHKDKYHEREVFTIFYFHLHFSAWKQRVISWFHPGLYTSRHRLFIEVNLFFFKN